MSEKKTETKQYKVLVNFYDLEDKNHLYRANGTYPREGYTPKAERIALLAGDKNKFGAPLIK